jgi:hypothetical protein
MEYLFTEENLKMILAPWERKVKTRGNCRVCSGLAAPGDGAADGTPPAAPRAGGSPLEEFILVKSSWQILKCPRCSRLYTDEYRYDHLVGGREDEYSITAIGYKEALELLKGIKAKKLTKTGATWVVSF